MSHQSDSYTSSSSCQNVKNPGCETGQWLPSVSLRPQKMQVLCLGLSRTGTLCKLIHPPMTTFTDQVISALCTALRTLGYATYHGTEVFKNTHDMHLKCWEEGLTAKYYNGKPYGRSEFDKLLKNYNVNICRLPEREVQLLIMLIISRPWRIHSVLYSPTNLSPHIQKLKSYLRLETRIVGYVPWKQYTTQYYDGTHGTLSWSMIP